MTYEPNGQYPPVPQDPNAGGSYPTSGPAYPTSAPGYPTSGATPPAGGHYPPPQPAGYQPATQQPGGYPPGGYPGYQQQAQAAAMGIDPLTGQPLSDKSKIVAGVLGIALGGFGVGRFYTGHVGIGIAQLLTNCLFGAGAIWGIIDGILILVNGGTDAEGRKLRDN